MAKVMTVSEAAEMLGVCIESIRRLARTGEIACSKPSQKLLFLEDDLLAYVMRYRRAASWELMDEADRRLEEMGRRKK